VGPLGRLSQEGTERGLMRAADLQPGDHVQHADPAQGFTVDSIEPPSYEDCISFHLTFGGDWSGIVNLPLDHVFPDFCEQHQHELTLHHLYRHIEALEATMTQFATNQAHLDADVAALRQAVSDAVAELKAAAANGQSLDFSKLDALVTDTQAEATADAPPAPAAPATPADGSAPADVPAAPVDGTTPPAA
jgi:hypothetical protein